MKTTPSPVQTVAHGSEAIDLDGLLRRLHLPTIRRMYPELETRAEAEEMSYRDFLGLLVVEEVAHRAETRIQRATRKANFPFLRTIEEFDFTDFSLGLLNLGSMKIPLPKNSQVQVEMGDAGPKMVHLVTEFGRVTPVAFAAPRSAGQWSESTEQITQGMIGDGLTVDVEQGPWGPEVVGTGEHGAIRVIGVEGPRWMLRMTATAPHDKADGLRDLTREITARTFVYRGDNPILAGNSLPVVLPQQLVAQVQQAMQQRNEQQK